MSDNPTPAGENMSEPNELYQSAKPKVKWTWWKTTVLITIALAAVGLTIYSSISYESAYKVSNQLIQWDSPPSYIGETPLLINELQEAWNSNNNLVLVITPCSDATLNDSVTALTVEAANSIRSTDRIYVGVFLMPQDDSLSYPTVRLRLYTKAAQSLTVTMKENLTTDLIYNNYLDRKFLRN